MDSRELNKIGAALLCAGLLFGAADLAGGALAPTSLPTRAQFAIAGAPADEAAGPVATPIADRLPHASAAHGELLAGNLCAACHSFAAGGPAIVGPNLHGVAGGAVAAVAGYDYSPALRQAGGRWTPARLDSWLLRPQAFAPGTRMGFAGIPAGTDRADVVAYLLALAAPAAAAATPATSPAADAAFARRVDAADPKAGADAAAVCTACHSFDRDGGAMVGPPLHGVFGRAIAQGPDYRYSAALSAHRGVWNVDTLNRWLASPRGFAPGNKMAFPGIADDAQRAAVVAYLRSLPDKP